MASLRVTRIEDDVYELLRIRATERGISMEEEVCRIITRSVTTPERLSQLALKCFGPEHGVELELPRRNHQNTLDPSIGG